MIKKILMKWKQDPRNTHSFPTNIEYSPLVKEVFNKIKDIQGWFNIDDCSHFKLLLSMQTLMGIKGDLFEIGSFHGRSTAMMAWCLEEDENIHVCDAFEEHTDDFYENKPSPKRLIANIKKVNPSLNINKIVIYQCLSNNLTIDINQKFRFIHIDGGHSAEQVYFDLNLSNKFLIQKGIIAIDDYKHNNWPGVTHGVEKFLSNNKTYSILADLNRHGAKGRKLYLMKIV